MPDLSAIRDLLRSLPEYPLSAALPRISLSTADCLRCAGIDSEHFTSRIAVKSHAEKLVSDRCQQAQEFLHTYLDTSSPDSFPHALRDRLEHRLIPLREKLSDLRNADNSAIINRILDHLNTETVMEHLKQQMSTSSFTLPPESFYHAKIEYETFNPADYETGLLKLAAILFCTYGYNAFDAIHDLESDTQKLLSNYHKTLSNTAVHLIQTQIVTPIQNKLSLL